MRTVVIDASVAIKWFVKHEEGKLQASYLLKKFKSEELEFIVPDLLFYEVANAFKSFISAKRITFVIGKRYIKKLIGLNLITINYSELIDLALNLSIKFNITIYDASYLALAKLQNLPFYTADQKLLNKISPSFKNAHYLLNLQTETN